MIILNMTQITCYNSDNMKENSHGDKIILNYLGEYIGLLKKNNNVRDIILAGLSLGISSLLYIIIRVILAKKLTVVDIGVYTILYLVYQFGSQFGSLGFPSTVIKYSAETKNDDSKRDIPSLGFIQSIINSIGITLIIFFTSPFLSMIFFKSSQYTLLFKITILTYPFLAAFRSVLAILNGKREMVKYFIVSVSLYILILILTTLSIYVLDLGLNGAIYSYCISSAFISVLSPIFIIKWLSFKKIIIVFKKYIKRLYLMSLVVFIGNFMSFLNSQISQFILAYFLSKYEIGIYSAAVTIFQFIILIPSAFQMISMPYISNLKSQKNYDKIKKAIYKFSLLSFIINTIIVVFLLIFGRQILIIIYTKEYVSAYSSLVLLLIGSIYYVPLVSVGGTFLSIGKPIIATFINLISIIIIFILNITIIPILGITGAALSTDVGLLFNTISYFYFFKRERLI